MKILTKCIAVASCIALAPTVVSAQGDPAPAAKKQAILRANMRAPMPGDAKRRLKNFQNIFILEADRTKVTWKENMRSLRLIKTNKTSLKGLYFETPEDIADAIALFENRKYNEARQKFAEARPRYKKFRGLMDNPHAIAGFYELECLRKLEDFEALGKAEREYLNVKELTRPHMVKQIELYEMWNLVRLKDWRALDNYCQNLWRTKLPGYQRAQVDYCHGLAFEGKGDEAKDKRHKIEYGVKALNSYARAMTADATKSEVITRNSVLNSLRIYSKDSEVKLAREMWGDPEENKQTAGRARLMEAHSVLKLYDKLGLGGGVAIPAKYKSLFGDEKYDITKNK